MGRKQCLAIAAARLKDLELLMLDEPTNGLDPTGMADVRAISRKVRQPSKTVLLYSHLLEEIEQICDRVGILWAEFLEEALRVTEALLGVEGARVDNDTLQLLTKPGRAVEINTDIEAGLQVSELGSVERSLKEVFLQLTAEKDAASSSQADVPTGVSGDAW